MKPCDSCVLLAHDQCEEEECGCVCRQLERIVVSPEGGDGTMAIQRPVLFHLWFEEDDLCLRREDGPVFLIKPGQGYTIKTTDGQLVTIALQEDPA